MFLEVFIHIALLSDDLKMMIWKWQAQQIFFFFLTQNLSCGSCVALKYVKFLCFLKIQILLYCTRYCHTEWWLSNFLTTALSTIFSIMTQYTYMYITKVSPDITLKVCHALWYFLFCFIFCFVLFSCRSKLNRAYSLWNNTGLE